MIWSVFHDRADHVTKTPKMHESVIWPRADFTTADTYRDPQWRADYAARVRVCTGMLRPRILK